MQNKKKNRTKDATKIKIRKGDQNRTRTTKTRGKNDKNMKPKNSNKRPKNFEKLHNESVKEDYINEKHATKKDIGEKLR